MEVTQSAYVYEENQKCKEKLIEGGKGGHLYVFPVAEMVSFLTGGGMLLTWAFVKVKLLKTADSGRVIVFFPLSSIITR